MSAKTYGMWWGQFVNSSAPNDLVQIKVFRNPTPGIQDVVTVWIGSRVCGGSIGILVVHNFEDTRL